jgi:hypothetical protein
MNHVAPPTFPQLQLIVEVGSHVAQSSGKGEFSDGDRRPD